MPLGAKLKDCVVPGAYPHEEQGRVADNRDLEKNPMQTDTPDEAPEDEPEPVEQYVPGVANGRHYMARLCHLPGSPWYIDVIHIESLPPLHDSGRTWLTSDEAAQAANKLVASLAQ